MPAVVLLYGVGEHRFVLLEKQAELVELLLAPFDRTRLARCKGSADCMVHRLNLRNIGVLERRHCFLFSSVGGNCYLRQGDRNETGAERLKRSLGLTTLEAPRALNKAIEKLFGGNAPIQVGRNSGPSGPVRALRASGLAGMSGASSSRIGCLLSAIECRSSLTLLP